MTEQRLPDNDRDLKLARLIGRYLEGEDALTGHDDPLFDSLAEYKLSRSEREHVLQPADSQKLWQKISKETASDEENKIYPIGKWSVWAAAATILIAAFIGIFYYLYTESQPQLLASTEDTIRIVQLDDGSEVRLRPHSSLYLLEAESGQFRYLLEGEAYFEIIPNEERLFSVLAGSGRVSVLGTSFNLSSWGERTRVYLAEGVIRFENIRSGNSAVLQPGQTASTAGRDSIVTTSDIGAEEFTDWLSQELIFQNKSARYVFEEIEQHYGITIRAPRSVLDMKLSGELSLENAEQSLNDLSLVLGGTFRKSGDNTYTFTLTP